MAIVSMHTGKWWYGKNGVGWVVAIDDRVSGHFTGEDAHKEATTYLNYFLSKEGYKLPASRA